MSEQKSDDEVGERHAQDDSRQTGAQRAVLGSGGEAGGLPEPKSPDEWARRGASGGEPGRSPPTRGGASQGHGDGKPAAKAGGR